MSYIGNNIPTGSYRKLSDISASFNGVTTTFQLSVPPGTAQYYVTPTSAFQLLISVGGVIQEPGVDFTLNGSQIVFSTAPATGLSFFGIQMGDALNVGTPSDGTVTTAKLVDGSVTTAKLVDSVLSADTSGRAKMVDGYITTAKLEDSSITPGKLSTSTFASASEVTGTHTTGTITSGSASLTVASVAGISPGMYVVGEGITPGTTVSTVVGTTITLSANAGATLSSDPVSFYISNKVLSPGLVAGQLCRAWVNFNGTGTVAIRASYNVSSITDNGTGDYTLNFTTAMADANYSAIAQIDSAGGSTSTPAALISSPTTSNVRFFVRNGTTGGFVDQSQVCVSIFR